MIFASCRAKTPLGAIVFGKLHWGWDTLPEMDLRGKRVLIIVHGTANTMAQLRRLAEEIARRNEASYDAFVMFCWPGGNTGLAYLLTRFTAVGRAAEHLRTVIDAVTASGAWTVDVDAHSLGVPVALEAIGLNGYLVDGLWLKAGACGRDLSKYRDRLETTAVHVFYSPKDFVVSVLYRIWFGAIGGALGAYGEKSKNGNIGVQHDVSPEIGGGHADYRACSIIVQAMRDEAERRKARQ